LPWTGRKPGVRLHQATADHVRRSVPGRIQLQWTRQHGAMPQHGRQSGVGLRCGGETIWFLFKENVLILHIFHRRNGFATRILDSAYSAPLGTMPTRRCCDPAATERASSGWWSPSSSGRLTSWMRHRLATRLQLNSTDPTNYTENFQFMFNPPCCGSCFWRYRVA